MQLFCLHAHLYKKENSNSLSLGCRYPPAAFFIGRVMALRPD